MDQLYLAACLTPYDMSVEELNALPTVCLHKFFRFSVGAAKNVDKLSKFHNVRCRIIQASSITLSAQVVPMLANVTKFRCACCSLTTPAPSVRIPNQVDPHSENVTRLRQRRRTPQSVWLPPSYKRRRIDKDNDVVN